MNFPLIEPFVDSSTKEIGYFLNNQFIRSKAAQTISISSPIDGMVLASVQSMMPEEIEKVVETAFLSQKHWERMFIHERVDILIKTAALLDEYTEFFTNLIIEEVAKPKKDAYDEVVRSVDLLYYYAEEGRRVAEEGQTVPADAFPDIKTKKMAITKRVPLGVVLAITPFNYPINEVVPKIVSALVMGNTVVLKPSTQGSICSLFLAELFKQAGLPKGVLGVATGPTATIGDALVSHQLIAAINFTGSYETALHITQKAGIKKFIFGLSGKDASLVLSDADIELAAKEIALGAFGFSGQRCTAIKRVLVEETIADSFVAKLTDIVSKNYVIGNPREEQTTLGPMVNEKTAEYVSGLIQDAKEQGVVIRCGGERAGRYMQATIVDMVTPHMRVAFEEPFGPILPIIRVKDEEEAVTIANQSEYGLQSSIFTRDIGKALRLAQKLDVGSVHINEKDARSPDHFPFTGFRHSGLGMVQGARYLLEEVSKIKSVVLPLQQ